MIEQEKDSLLEKAYTQAQELKKEYGADIAYEYLLNIIYYRLNGKFRDSDKE